MTYKATDDDLPTIFWSEATPDARAAKSLDNAARGVAVQVHFPVVQSPLTQKQQRDIERDRMESAEHPESKRQFVKLGKKQQMYSWLLVLENSFGAMDDGKRRFCEQTLAKFRKYTVQGAKWITLKQYQWLKFIASKYIVIPGGR